MKRVLAIDIGASSGRAMLCTYDGDKISMQEIHRFANEPVSVCGHIHWDILRLFHEVKHAIKIADKIDSIGIDTWGVDYGMTDKHGSLIMNPYHYRDIRNERAQRLDIYSKTGIQFMQFNTVYQLQLEDLSMVHKILLIPDLIAYFLTGNMRMEYTNASTTDLLNAYTHELDESVLAEIGINRSLFPEMIKPGEYYGMLCSDVCRELGVEPIPVMAVGTHDTASAVASIPAYNDEELAYISSGTWSLFGTLSDKPVLNEESRRLNFTNELGVDFRIRLLKNIMGLWLMQELRREYDTTFPALQSAARNETPFRHIIDPDSTDLIGMGNMINRLNKAAKSNLSMGEAARCIYDSLALKYRYTLSNLEKLTGKKYRKLYMFGGGIQDELLCELTANACGIDVAACSSEATALGNAAVQIADNMSDIPDLMIRSTKTKVYRPNDQEMWEAAYEKAKGIFSLTEK